MPSMLARCEPPEKAGLQAPLLAQAASYGPFSLCTARPVVSCWGVVEQKIHLNDPEPDVFTDSVESLRRDPLFDKVFQCLGNWDAEDFCLRCFSMHTASLHFLIRRDYRKDRGREQGAEHLVILSPA